MKKRSLNCSFSEAAVVRKPARRGRGRPRVSDEPMSAVMTRLPVRCVGRLERLADIHRMTRSEFVRGVLERVVDRADLFRNQK